MICCKSDCMCSILKMSLFNLCLPNVDICDKTRSCVVKSITSILGFTPQHHCSSIGFFVSLTLRSLDPVKFQNGTKMVKQS